MLAGAIPDNISAICVDFRYATTRNASISINIYIQNDDIYSLVQHIEGNTAGNWSSTHFACCLPKVKNEMNVSGIPMIFIPFNLGIQLNKKCIFHRFPVAKFRMYKHCTIKKKDSKKSRSIYNH